MQDGDDVSSAWSTWRRMRIWRMLLTGDLVSAAARLDVGWHDDNLSKGPSWLDIPGFKFAVPLTGDRGERFLMEFVVAVLSKPDAGAVYYYVIVSRNALQYRVQMSDGRSLAFNRWPQIQSTARPWVNESGCRVAIDSTWLPFV
jgi:hypothetical protein